MYNHTFIYNVHYGKQYEKAWIIDASDTKTRIRNEE